MPIHPHTRKAAALLLAIIATAAPVAHAGFPVIDAPNLMQSIKNMLELSKQVKKSTEMVTKAQKQIEDRLKIARGEIGKFTNPLKGFSSLVRETTSIVSFGRDAASQLTGEAKGILNDTLGIRSQTIGEFTGAWKAMNEVSNAEAALANIMDMRPSRYGEEEIETARERARQRKQRAAQREGVATAKQAAAKASAEEAGQAREKGEQQKASTEEGASAVAQRQIAGIALTNDILAGLLDHLSAVAAIEAKEMTLIEQEHRAAQEGLSLLRRVQNDYEAMVETYLDDIGPTLDRNYANLLAWVPAYSRGAGGKSLASCSGHASGLEVRAHAKAPEVKHPAPDPPADPHAP